MAYKLSPSKAHRFLNCTKSLEYDVETETPASIRGSMLHEYASMQLSDYLMPEDYDKIEIFRQKNNINDYEERLISYYINAVRELQKEFAGKLTVEVRRTMPIFGNDIDFIIDSLILGHTRAAIIDLKTGRVDVEPENNDQLLFYSYYVAFNFPNVKSLTIGIFQKCKLKTIEISPENVFDYMIGKEHVFEDIKNGNLTFNPGEKTCRYCAHKNECIARSNWILGGKK